MKNKLLCFLVIFGFLIALDVNLASDVSDKSKPKIAKSKIDNNALLESAEQTNNNQLEAIEPSAQTVNVVQNNRSGEEVNWKVQAGGAFNGGSANYYVNGTVAQTVSGPRVSTTYNLNSGFWQNFEVVPDDCDCLPGDANFNAIINILDITYLINYLYKLGPEPIPYAKCSGDPNHTCNVNILDITHLINYLYKGGPPPCTCSEWQYYCGGLRK